MRPFAFDTETYPFKQGRIIPPIVCYSTAVRDEDGELQVALDAVAENDFDDRLEALILDEQNLLVGHFMAYDLCVVMERLPHLVPDVFRLAREGRASCTKIREQLLMLSDHGNLKFRFDRKGNAGRLDYSLAGLEMRYIGRDRSADKKGDEVWRANYDKLVDVPLDEWPEDAANYAMDDAEGTLLVWEGQQEESESEDGYCSFGTEAFQVACDMAFYLQSAIGVMVDVKRKRKLIRRLNRELDEGNLQLIIQAGILRPSEPARPHAGGHKDHVEGCRRKGCDCPVKLTEPVKASLNRLVLQERVLRIWNEHKDEESWGDPKLTDSGLKKFEEGHEIEPSMICTDAEVMERVAALDPVLTEYQYRQSLQKLVTTEIPRMGKGRGPVHPGYRVLVESGRSSCGSTDKYPSFNIQNVDPRARPVFVPRKGNLILSVDVDQMELVTFAQQCLRVLGFSVLAERINAGIDPHAFLGAQIAYALSGPFRKRCMREGRSDPDDVYDLFKELKGSHNEKEAKLFKKYRKYAKPTGLGYPGGLGAKTFISYSKGTFKMDVDLETAKQLRAVWFDTYPEARAYFDWLTSTQIDYRNSTDEQQVYYYQSPFGMFRAGCTFCKAANGFGLQTPGAEGAKLANFNVVEACLNPEQGSILFGACLPFGFIHDEVLLEVPDDDLAHDRAMEVVEIVKSAMKQVCPDMRVGAEASLMRRWYKQAEPVYDDNGCLIPWEPSKKTPMFTVREGGKKPKRAKKRAKENA